MSDAQTEPIARPALGPGDADPQSQASAGRVAEARPPLGPGDDDPRSPAVRMPAAVPAHGPGTLVGDDPNEGFIVIAPPPAGPGEIAITRSIVRFPKPAAPAIPAVVAAADEPIQDDAEAGQ